jgi:hypothetical protein
MRGGAINSDWCRRNQALDWLARKMRIASTTMFVKLVDQKTPAIVLSPMNIAGDRAWFIASHFDQAALYKLNLRHFGPPGAHLGRVASTSRLLPALANFAEKLTPPRKEIL